MRLISSNKVLKYLFIICLIVSFVYLAHGKLVYGQDDYGVPSNASTRIADDDKQASEMGVVGGIKSTIFLYYSKNKAFPQSLDNASLGNSSSLNQMFTILEDPILRQQIKDNWIKLSEYEYKGPTGKVYKYNPSDGSFSNEFVQTEAIPTGTSYDKCRITGISYSDENQKIVVDGQNYSIGDPVCGGQIVDISSDGVSIQFSDKQVKYKSGNIIEGQPARDCRITDIIYSEENPVIYVDGEEVNVNDSVCGGKILNVSPDQVTVQLPDKQVVYGVGDTIVAGPAEY